MLGASIRLGAGQAPGDEVLTCPSRPPPAFAPQQALNVGAPEVAQKALRYASEFGLSHDSYKEFHPLMIYYSKQVGSGRGGSGACQVSLLPPRGRPGRAAGSACRARCAPAGPPMGAPRRALQSSLPRVPWCFGTGRRGMLSLRRPLHPTCVLPLASLAPAAAGRAAADV